MTIGGNIKNAREKAGLSQKELAKKMGVTPQTLSMYEKNRRNPKLSTIRKFAEAIGVTLSEIIGENWEDFTAEEMQEDFFEQKIKEQIFSDEDWQVDIIVGKALSLSEEGRYKVIEYEDDLILSGKYTNQERNRFTVQAAHERTDIEVTDEMHKHDDDIMDDDNF